MAVNAAPSGKAPPGRLRFGAATMALATAFPVAACGSHADNSAGPAAAGPWSAHAGERFLDLRMAEAYTPRRRRAAALKHLADGYRTTQTPEERLT